MTFNKEKIKIITKLQILVIVTQVHLKISIIDNNNNKIYLIKNSKVSKLIVKIKKLKPIKNKNKNKTI